MKLRVGQNLLPGTRIQNKNWGPKLKNTYWVLRKDGRYDCILYGVYEIRKEPFKNIDWFDGSWKIFPPYSFLKYYVK